MSWGKAVVQFAEGVEALESQACTRPTQRPGSPQLVENQEAYSSPVGQAAMVGSWLWLAKGSLEKSPVPVGGMLTYRRWTTW